MTHPRTIHDRILAHARERPDAPFMTVLRAGKRESLTYRELSERSASYASEYAERGVRRGDIVAIVLPQCVELFPAYLGALRLGAVPTLLPLPSTRQDPDIFWKVQDATLGRLQAALVVTDAASLAELHAHLPGHARRNLDVAEVRALPPAGAIHDPGIDEDQVAILQHSSGTTGQKKGVALSHRVVVSHLDAYAQALGLSRADRIATWLPHYHDMGLVACFLMPAVFGLPIVCLDPFEWVLQPTRLLDVIDEHECTLAWLPNFAFHHIVRATSGEPRWRLHTMRAFVDASEPCRPETLEAFRRSLAGTGLRPTALQVLYGMAENVFAVTQTSLESEPRVLTVDREALLSRKLALAADASGEAMRFVSCGRPIPGTRIAVRREDGTMLPEAHVGEIAVGGRTLFSGYHHVDGPTPSLRDGWYATGDIGFMVDGELYVMGRIDDRLLVNGRNVYAHDAENAVNLYTDVKPGRCIALGVWSEEKGSHELVLVVETQDGAGDEDPALRRRIGDVVASATGVAPSAVHFVGPGWLLKTTSGKVSRDANLTRFLRTFGRQ